jgi:WD40 repeat protein
MMRPQHNPAGAVRLRDTTPPTKGTPGATGTPASVGGTTSITFKGHTGAVEALSWSPDGTRIVSGGDDMTVQVWDATEPKPVLYEKTHTKPVLPLE